MSFNSSFINSLTLQQVNNISTTTSTTTTTTTIWFSEYNENKNFIIILLISSAPFLLLVILILILFAILSRIFTILKMHKRRKKESQDTIHYPINTKIRVHNSAYAIPNFTSKESANNETPPIITVNHENNNKAYLHDEKDSEKKIDDNESINGKVSDKIISKWSTFLKRPTSTENSIPSQVIKINPSSAIELSTKMKTATIQVPTIVIHKPSDDDDDDKMNFT